MMIVVAGFEELSCDELIAALAALTSAFVESQAENARLRERVGKLGRQVSRNSRRRSGSCRSWLHQCRWSASQVL
jgi:hypothetical protein